MIAKQEVLARRTGIPRSTISALENNRLFLSAPYALLIREELGCTLDDLYETITPSPGRGEKPDRQRG
jgi:transcriptional regulator with XRE-family HTH domain